MTRDEAIAVRNLVNEALVIIQTGHAHRLPAHLRSTVEFLDKQIGWTRPIAAVGTNLDDHLMPDPTGLYDFGPTALPDTVTWPPGAAPLTTPERTDPWAMSPEELLAALLSARAEMADAQEKTAEATARAEGAEAERDRYRLAATTATEEWKAWQTRAVTAETERDAHRRELPQLDCRRTGGPVSDTGGAHCPLGEPCLRCQRDRLQERLVELEEAAKASTARVAALTAEVKHREWVDKGAPMSGEFSGDPPDAQGWRPTGDPYWWTKP